MCVLRRLRFVQLLDWQPDHERGADVPRAADLERSTQLADPLFDPAKAQPDSLSLGRDPSAIVAHRHIEPVIASRDGHADRSGRGVPDTIRQRFLDDAVDAGAVLVRKWGEIPGDVQLHGNAVAAIEVADVPFECGLKAEVIEHAGAEPEGEIAD